MCLELIGLVLIFVLMTFGPAWPWVARWSLSPAEKVTATTVLSLLLTYLVGLGVYVARLPVIVLGGLPLAGIVGLLAGRRALGEVLRDPVARAMLIGLGLVTGWSLGWLALVASYSGGGWTADWYEHWERARFFLERWPETTRFLGRYLLPARPPLANVVTGAMLVPFGATFPAYQVVTTLLNVVVFLPAALLALRFLPAASPGESPVSHRAVIGVLTVLVMVNPSFMENATFAWTKLIAAGLVLSGVYFFLRARDGDAPPAALPLCAASLAAGILAHFSAGPYVVLLAVAWVATNYRRGLDSAFWRQSAVAMGIGGAILATWFAWSFAHYGVATTLSSNSSTAVQPEWQNRQLLKVVLNLRDTVVPHFLRSVDPELLEQRSPWSHARDWFFQVYQVNVLFALGSVAWLAVLVALVRDARSASASSRVLWTWLAGGTVLLGVAVHGARDQWGLAHICLQGLVVLGLAYLAARWSRLSRGWRYALIAGGAVDFSLGVALQFAAESQTPDLAMALGRAPADAVPFYNTNAVMNLAGKLTHNLSFLRDALALPVPVILGFLGVVLLLAVRWVRAVAR